MAVSNYMNSVNSMYTYGYDKMRSVSSAYNTAGIKKTPEASGTGETSQSQKQSYMNSDALSYLTSIRDGANRLMKSMEAVTGGSAFSKMVAVSADNSVLSVNENSDATVAFKDTQVDVQQTAAAQVNEGNGLDADAQFGEAGIKQFEIEQNGRRFQFSIDVRDGDTNRDVQQRMADAVNNRNIGVTATVSENSDSGESTLSFQSRNTGQGAENEFTVRDTNGDLAASTGVTQTSQTARDAVYRINNRATLTSKTNNVDLGNGVSATLQSAGSVTVNADRNTTAQTDAAKNIVEGFNNLLSAAKSGPQNNRLLNDLNGARNSYATSLERIGITADKDGNLKINEETLEKAAEDGTLGSFFAQTNGANFGFTNRLTRIADNVSDNAASYNYNSAASGNNRSGNQNFIQNAINSYKQNMNTYAYSYNAPGVLYNNYA